MKAKKMSKLLCLLAFWVLFVGCDFFVYKPNVPEPYLTYIENNYWGEVVLKWDEKLDIDTTKKQNYRTEIYISKINVVNDDLINVNRLYRLYFPSWVIPESVYIVSINPLKILFIYGTDNNQYGTDKTLGYYYAPSLNNETININISDLISLSGFSTMIPSPDRNHLIVLSKDDVMRVYRLDNKLTFLRENRTYFNIDHDSTTWSNKDFSMFYIYANNKMYYYNTSNNLIGVASSYPECFYPRTSFGGNISSGYRYIYDIQSKSYKRIKLNNFTSFEDKKFVNRISLIKDSCYQ